MKITGLDEAVKRAAMKAMEQGVREASTYMCELLRMTVSGPGAIPHRGPLGRGTSSPFTYRRKGGGWESKPPEWSAASRFREGPPGSRTGKAIETIGYKIIERNFSAGYIVVLIGVTSEARGGMDQLPSYLLGWDVGIRIKGPGDTGKIRTGPVVQRPWLRSTVSHYIESFASIISANMSGI